MSIKDRVLASMKTSYAKYGFKKSELNQLADIISNNLKDESTDEEITSALSANEGFAQMMQSVYNRGVSETNEKYKDYIPKPADPEPQPQPAPNHNPTPAPQPAPQSLTREDIQKLINAGIAEGLKPYKEREEKQRLQSLLQNNPKLKDVPKVFRERYTLANEGELDNTAEQCLNDYTALTQGLVQSGKFVEAPKKSTPGSEDDDFRKMMEASAQRIAEKTNLQPTAPAEPATK